MKVKIISKDFHITLFVPLSLIKWKIISKHIISKCIIERTEENSSINGTDNLTSDFADRTEENCSIHGTHKLTSDFAMRSNTKNIPKIAYKIIKEFKRDYGSFSFIDVHTKDGTIVEINI